MAARRNTNNRRYWPRSSILYPPMEIVGGVVNHPVEVLTTAAVSIVAPTVHESDKVVTTLVVTRQAVWSIQ